MLDFSENGLLIQFRECFVISPLEQQHRTAAFVPAKQKCSKNTRLDCLTELR